MKIYNGTVITCGGAIYREGYVAFLNGVITEVGAMSSSVRISPGDLDARGGYIIPGLIDPHCHVGCGPEGIGVTEYSETFDPIVPYYNAVDAFLPTDPAIKKARRRGITTVVSGPGSTALIGGQLAAFKLNDAYGPDACIRQACAIKFALGEAPKSAFGRGGRAPVTRMAEAALIRNALTKAKDDLRKIERGEDTMVSAKSKALFPLLRGEIPAHIHAQRKDDIRMALRLGKEFNFHVVTVHGVQAPSLLDEIARQKAGVIFGPLLFTSRDMESDGISFRGPVLSQQAGVLTAICTDACPGLGSVQMLATCAALTVREGMKPLDALRSITLDAARTAGIEHRVGALEVGKDADIVVFDQFPLELTAHVRALFIDGRRMDL